MPDTPPANAPAIIAPPPPHPPHPAPMLDTDGDKLSRFCDELESANSRGQLCQVTLQKVAPDGSRAPAGRFGADFDPYAIGISHGPGKYFARLKVDGAWSGSVTFTAEGPMRPATLPTPTPPPSALQNGEVSPSMLITTLFGFMQHQAQQQTQLLTTLLSRDSGPKLSELIALIKPQKSDVGELIAGLRELQAIAPDGGGGGEDETTGLLKAFAPILAGFMQPQQHAPPQQRRPLPMNAGPTLPPPRPPAPPGTIATPSDAPPPPPLKLTKEPDPREELGRRLAAVITFGISTGLAPDTAAVALEDVLLSAEPEAVREEAIAATIGLQPAEIADTLAMLAPDFAEPAKRQYVIDTIGELAELLTDADGQEEETPDDPRVTQEADHGQESRQENPTTQQQPRNDQGPQGPQGGGSAADVPQSQLPQSAAPDAGGTAPASVEGTRVGTTRRRKA